MTRKSIAIASATALAAGAAAAFAVSAQGQESPGRTLTLKAAQVAPRDGKEIDVKPRGISIGDRFLGAQTLRDGDRAVGRLETDCVVLDASYQGQQCVITLLLRDGQITAQGAGVNRRLPGASGAPDDSRGDDSAITGGTGAYASASGTLNVRSSRKGDTLTLALEG